MGQPATSKANVAIHNGERKPDLIVEAMRVFGHISVCFYVVTEGESSIICPLSHLFCVIEKTWGTSHALLSRNSTHPTRSEAICRDRVLNRIKLAVQGSVVSQ